jgi:predicted Ser/Thr protein kinase
MNNNQILGVYIIDFDRANFNKELRNLPQFLTFAFNNLGFKQYFYLIKEIIYFYRKIFKKYLSFREDY